jgi:hypothetical protein
MARLYMVFFALEVLLVVLALISCLSAEEGEVRALPRIIWVILILLFPLVGSIVYFAAGRPVTAGQRQTWRPGSGFPEASRPPRQIAPDDDPEFLRTLDRQGKRQDEDMLRRWEEDLRRREDELRKKDKTADDTPTDS